MQHLSSSKAEGKQFRKFRSLEEVPAALKKQLLDLCRLAWEGILKQELTYSSNAVSGQTLGLMHGVKELYGEKDGQLTYHFVHLTLQEFLSAYHITQLPTEKQEQVIQDHVSMGHLQMVLKFYFGLTEPNTFTSTLISEEISKVESAATYHWLFETGNVEMVTKLMAAEEQEVEVRSSYAWSPLDYYVLGYAIAHYQYQWTLNFRWTSMGNEGVEMLCKGISSAEETNRNGKISEVDMSGNHITSEGVKWLKNIPPQIMQQITEVYVASNELDRNALDVFSKFIPKLSNLQSLSLSDNPIGNGGAVEILKCLHYFKTPLKKLNLRNTAVGEEDGEHLALLIADTDLKTLYISGGLLSSIMKYSPPYSTLQTLYMSHSELSDEDIVSLSSLIQQSMWQLRKLDIYSCNITTERAVQLATALTHNNSLRVLDMRWNRIGPDGAKAMCAVIQVNKFLRELDLCGDKSLSKGVKWILSSLKKNTTLRTLTLSHKYKRTSDQRVRWH